MGLTSTSSIETPPFAQVEDSLKLTKPTKPDLAGITDPSEKATKMLEYMSELQIWQLSETARSKHNSNSKNNVIQYHGERQKKGQGVVESFTR